MKVNLNIQEDAELRAAIKEAIKGQINSIIREEVIEFVKEEITRKIKGGNVNVFNNMLQSAMQSAVTGILYQDFKTWDSKFIDPYVSKKLDETLKNKDWNATVNELVMEKIKKLIS